MAPKGKAGISNDKGADVSILKKLKTKINLRDKTDKNGNPLLKIVGPLMSETNVLYVFRKDEQELADQIDTAIESITKDGTLAKLSVQ